MSTSKNLKLKRVNAEINNTFKAAGVLLYSFVKDENTDQLKVKVLIGCEDRRHKPKGGFLFAPFGGKVEQGENAYETAIREFNEETAYLFNDDIQHYNDLIRNPDHTRVFWIPSSKYVLFCTEIDYDDSLSERFLEIDKTGFTNTDQIFIEWVDKNRFLRGPRFSNPIFTRDNGEEGKIASFFISMFGIVDNHLESKLMKRIEQQSTKTTKSRFTRSSSDDELVSNMSLSLNLQDD
ncbi:hypothetical protein CYY_004157 [Polysphondylium violaceum]|uniref:Nudix hydrolase domain-containing protein n=1 Tax=Polysphondylium violaceum TaxID=133409 RepID=A0A8J4PVP4_9MYCE|nr:hypothetical protein CYY_004157 [Polysphondylium violaceum]